MFAPPVAKAKTKIPAGLTKGLAHQRSELTSRPGHSLVDQALMLRRAIGNQAVLRLLAAQRDASGIGIELAGRDEQGAARSSQPARGTKPGTSWDFSAIPIFPPDRAGQTEPTTPRSTPSLSGVLQAKLAVGRVDDPLEHEADRVADQVIRMPVSEVAATWAPPQINRKCAAGEEAEEEKLQKKEAGTAAAGLGEAPASVHQVVRSPGQPLAAFARAYFEPRFGHDFGDVRVHTDAAAAKSARAVGAQAYTAGRHVVFSEGSYSPHRPGQSRLLAHELVHVIQQARGGGASSRPLGAAKLDRERDAAASVVAVDRPAVHISGSSSLRLARQPLIGEFFPSADRPQSVTGSLSVESLDDAALMREIKAIREWLKLHPSDPDSEFLQSELDRLERGQWVREEKREKAEKKREEKFQATWQHASDADLDEKISKVSRELYELTVKGSPDRGAVVTLLERLKRVRARRRDVRRARPVTGPTTVSMAIAMLEEAQREAEIEDVPDEKRSLELVTHVSDWLNTTASPDKYDEYFGGMSGTVARQIVGGAKSWVDSLRSHLYFGGTVGGIWETAINSVKAAREYLEVMAKQKTLQQTSLQGLQETTNRILKYEAAGYGATV